MIKNISNIPDSVILMTTYLHFQLVYMPQLHAASELVIGNAAVQVY